MRCVPYPASRRSLAHTLALLLALCLAPACSDDGAANPDGGVPDRGAGDTAVADVGGGDGAGDAAVTPAGANPLVPEVKAFPFPSDFYTVADSTSPTGRRVRIPQSAVPSPILTKVFDKMDGFSLLPPILAALPGGIDPKTLPSPTDPTETLKADSPVQLVEEKTWTRVPILAEIDMMDDTPTRRALIVRPLTLLKPNTGYVVLVTNKLKTVAGTPHKAGAAFAALRDGTTSSDPAVEKQRNDFKLVNDAIAGLKLKPADVVLGWSFHTRSEQGITKKLHAIQQAAALAPLTAPTITSDKQKPEGTRTNRQLVGTFTAPNYVGKDGEITLDSSGKAVAQGTREVSFGITIPSTVTSTRPVIVYGHGFLGTWIQGTRGIWNEISTEAKWSTVCTNFGFHEDLSIDTITALTADMTKMPKVVSEVAQSMANNTVLARLAAGPLTQTLTVKDSSGKTVPLFDKDKVYYHGVSNGGTFGYLFAATSPVIERASIIVGGGGLSHFLQRAVNWWDFLPGVQIVYPDPRHQLLLMTLAQLGLDPVDPINYAPYLIKGRLPGTKPLIMAVHMAVGDSQVNNLVTEWMVRSAGIPLITPSPKQIWGLSTITAPDPGGAPAGTKGAMFVYDEKVKPSPIVNIPPKTDNKTHGTVRRLKGYRKHVITFIEQGKWVQTCSGACDPE